MHFSDKSKSPSDRTNQLTYKFYLPKTKQGIVIKNNYEKFYECAN